MRVDLERAMARLTDKQRAALWMWAGLGWTHDEIAELCGVGRAAITRRIRRACETLAGGM